MIGVTIGIGPKWRELAELAAAAAQQWTGLQVVVLGDEQFRHSRLASPVMFKTAVFDYVQEENLLIFDADLFFVRRWDPSVYENRRELVCVRDFGFENHIIFDAARFGISPDEYFNAGMLIANRTHHAKLFEHARLSLYERPSPLIDQSVLNAARIRMRVPALFLDRRFNTLCCPKGGLWDFAQPIGIHAAGDDDKSLGSDFAGMTQAGVDGAQPQWAMDDEVAGELADRFYSFEVDQHPPRALELRADGTVGMGSMDLERYWIASRAGTDVVLRMGHRFGVTAELRLDEHGEWRGAHLGTAIESRLRLAKHPAQVAAEQIRQKLPERSTGAIVGAGRGTDAAILLKQCPELSLLMIDEWTEIHPDDAASQDNVQAERRRQREALKSEAIAVTTFAESRRFIVDRPLEKALGSLQEQSLNFVILNAKDRAEPLVTTEIAEWMKRIRPGGLLLLCGPPVTSFNPTLQQLLGQWPGTAAEDLGSGVTSLRRPATAVTKTAEIAAPAVVPAAATVRPPSFINKETARPAADAFLRQVPLYPEDRYHGRGIVICAGGTRYLTCAWVCINMLRRAGCRLPIEMWQTTQFEMDRSLRELFAPLDVTCVNAQAVRRKYPVRRLAGWELKPFAMLHSAFKELILLDADNVALADPAILFDSPQFKKTGAIFWPDFGSLDADREIWKICRVKFRSEPEFETGQIVLDKQRCWQALQLTMHLNEYSDFYYQHIHGDKETFHMAWRMLDQDYSMVPFPIVGLPGCMCQHDFSGKRIFQHRNMAKWTLDAPNSRIPDFREEAECFQLLDELQKKWDGTIGCDWVFNPVEEKAASSVIQQRLFEYVRVGHDSRPMEFLPAGKIGKGRAGCEESWFVEEESTGVSLVIVGKGEQTCRLKWDEGGAWRGRWLVHERMPIKLAPLTV